MNLDITDVYVQNSASASLGTVRPVVDLTIGGEESSESPLGRVRDVEMMTAGELIVLDQFAGHLKVYSAQGELLRTIGRSGQGPGELSEGADRVLGLPDGSLVVVDLQQSRLQRFDPSGADLGTISLDLAGDGVPVSQAVHPDGRIIEGVRRIPGLVGEPAAPEPVITLRARRGEETETWFRIRVPDVDGGGFRVRLLAPEPVWAVAPSGELVLGDPATYRIQVVDSTGDVRFAFGRPFEPRPISRSDKEMLTGLFAGYMQRNGMPESDARMVARMSTTVAPEYPAFTRILVDDRGRIWVQRAAEAEELVARGLEDFTFDQLGSSTWDVFDDQGTYQAVVEVPPGFWLTRVRGEHLVGHTVTAAGYPIVQRLRWAATSSSAG